MKTDKNLFTHSELSMLTQRHEQNSRAGRDQNALKTRGSEFIVRVVT
jgi:hypothetical protein